MISKIKVEKLMRIDELIKNVWDGELLKGDYYNSNTGDQVWVDKTGVSFSAMEYPVVLKDELFHVTVEEEITLDTKFEGLQEVYLHKVDGEIEAEQHPPHHVKSIRDVLEEHDVDTRCLQIYARIEGKLKLIWESETFDGDPRV